MKRLKGISPKLGNAELPPFLTDLFYDLRERRLLPLVALILVAIVAAPFLLGGGSEEEPASPQAGISVADPAAEASVLNVVEAHPGLRDYRKRLARRRAVDPFKQRYTAPVLKDAQLNESSSTSSTTTTTTTSGSGSSPSGSEIEASPTPAPSSPSEGDGGGQAPSHLTYFTFAIDLKMKLVRGDDASAKKGGFDQEGEATIRHGVKPATPLPGEKAPTITYMGAIENATTALFLVSDDVSSLFGDGKCLSGTDSCQLVGVEVGVPETFVYGYNQNRLKINVLKIEPVVTGHS